MNSQNKKVAKVLCPSCAHENRVGAQYCSACGSILDRHCWKCAAKVSVDAKYCDACGADLEKAERDTLPGPSPSTGVFEKPERRQMTVMFCDLVDSTNLSRMIDPEELRVVLRSYQDACAEIIERYDGYVSRYVGDGIFILFGYPQAHDDDAERAARAALDMVERIPSLLPDTSSGPVKLSIRIGIATGLVVAGDVIGEQASQEEAIVGETPNLAARLQGLAEHDRILVSQSTHRLIRDRLTCRSLGVRNLRGYPEPVPVFEVVSPDASPELPSDTKTQRPVPMIGRDRDLAFLKDLWIQAKEGAGHVVLVQGEPGIGKSRLVEEIRGACEAESCYALVSRCSPYFTNSALYSVINLLRRLLKISGDDSPEKALAKLKAAVGPRCELPASARDLAFALSRSQRKPNGVKVVPLQPQRAQPFEAIVAFFLGLSEDKPLLLIVEDLHWVDPSTLQLLGLLVDQVPMARILVLATARPDFRPEWLAHGHTSQLTLGRLMPTEAKSLVTALTTDTPLPESVYRDLVVKTDGVPLFIEELTRTVVDLGASADAEATESMLSRDGSVVIPDTLRDSLMARLDRLQDAKPVAQLAAVIGRTFPYKLLKSAAMLAETDLNSRLERLVKAELVYQRGMPPSAIYHFKHSLIQDTAYDSLLNSKRREFHGRIGAILEKEFPEVGNTNPELIARHYTLGGMELKAAELWVQASELALQRGAGIEAINHAREGLRAVAGIEASENRDRLALALQVTLGTALSATKGYAIPDVNRAYSEALQLCKKLGADRDLFPVLRGLQTFYLLRGPMTRAKELGRQLVEIAEQQRDSNALALATRCLGWAVFCSGDMEEGKKHIERAVSLYDQSLSREYTRQNVSDPGGVGLINLAWANWFLGYPDTAVSKIRQALELGRQIDHPFTIAYALCLAATIHQCRREPEAVRSLSEDAIDYSREHGLRYWLNWGTLLQGWATVQLDDHVKGIYKLQEGLAGYRSTGATLCESYMMCLLAESLARHGDEQKAADLLREALRVEEKNESSFYSAETSRSLGEILWLIGEKKEAMEKFTKAQEIAQRQGAKSLELRAAASLAKFSHERGQSKQARSRLAELLKSFDQGHDTADYRDALELV